MALSIQQPINANSGTSGGFDVYLSNLSAGTSGVTIGGFSFELQSSSGDVVLNSASTATTLPYIFAGNSFADDFFGGDLTIQNTPDLIALDFASAPNTGTLIQDGQTVAIGHVSFSVLASAPTELVPLTFVNGAYTTLSDPFANAIPINSLTGGNVSITATVSAVPESPAWSLLLVVLLILAPRLRRVFDWYAAAHS